ncbi:MAG: Calx-beta domain-containing protein [Candidatus Thiodiazotropha sp. LLP2]
MLTRNPALTILSLFTLLFSFQSQAAVTVYCCDANAEAQYIQDLAALTSVSVDMTTESFEGSDWAGTRTTPQVSVTSQSVTWAASSTGVSGVRTSTGGGDVHEGSYLLFAADQDNGHLVPDKITLTANGITLYGTGGWFRSSGGAQIGFTTNRGIVDFPGEQATVFDWGFLGFIDDAGFSTLLIEAVDETGPEANIFFSDDFTLAAEAGAFPGQKLQFSSGTYSVSENASNVQITVERSGGTSGALSVDYEIATGGTATSGQDYTDTSGTLNFADGETTQTFTVDLIDDGVYEGDETVNLLLSGTDLGVLNSATLTIQENDSQPVGQVLFSGSDYTIAEGAGSVTITVQRNDGSLGSGSVDYATADTSANAGSDYTSTSGTLSFTDGQISASFTVAITDDGSQEGSESFMVSLSNPVSVSLGDQDFTEVTILDNESAAAGGSFQFSGSSYLVTEGVTQISVPVTRINGSTGAVSVVCSTTNSSAVAGSDYTTTSSTLSFASGEIVQHCNVPIADDSSYENDETFAVSLGSLSGSAVLGTPVMATVTIQDNDPVPAAGSLQFSLSEFSQTEDSATATISVSRTGGSTGAVAVAYSTSDDSATAGEDYTAASGTLNLASGTSSAAFQITLIDDNAYEGDEQIDLNLSNPTGGAVLGSNSSAVLTVNDNEQAPVSGAIAFTTAEYSAEEFDGSVTITVERVGGSSGSALVNYATSDGSATAGSDYEVASGTLVFADGEVSKSFDVSLTDDANYEGSEIINLKLSTIFGAIFGSQVTSTINLGDDDSAPAAGAVDFSLVNYDVTEDGASVTVNVSRNDGSTGAISVDYATFDISAVASSDYEFAAGRINFADGETTSKSFDVTINDDTELEGSEQIALQLGNVQGGAVLGSQSDSVITIADDEVPADTAVLAFQTTSLSVDESSATATLTITRTTSTSGVVTVDLAVDSSNSTATAGTDFNVTTGTLQFADGESSKSIVVEIINNTTVDGDRTITFTVGNVTGSATIDSASNTMLITILDDDNGSTPTDPGDDGDSGGGGGGSLDLILLVIMLSTLILVYRRPRAGRSRL